ncbi:hypothetical protein BCR43DRAFT_467532, partial [Syncephalastrum racemosum]
MVLMWERRHTTKIDSLPTLSQVLRRQTRPPVCLYNYYIVLRDRLELEHLLDFWLDVQQVHVMHRRYVKQQNRQQKKHEHMGSDTTSTPSNASSSFPLTRALINKHQQQHRPSIVSHTTQTTHMTVVDSTMLSQSIERIYLRYLVPNAEKELIQVPTPLRDAVTDLIHSKASALDPSIFDPTACYIAQILHNHYPTFLRCKAWMNLTWHQQIGRIAAGLLGLLVGFSLEFSLIFLDIKPWQYRIWGLLPIWFGVFCVTTGLVGLDPIWVLFFNVSETTTFRFNTIQQPAVKRILAE